MKERKQIIHHEDICVMYSMEMHLKYCVSKIHQHIYQWMIINTILLWYVTIV